MLLQVKDYAGAKSAYETALVERPGSGFGLYGLARVKETLRRYEWRSRGLWNFSEGVACGRSQPSRGHACAADLGGAGGSSWHGCRAGLKGRRSSRRLADFARALCGVWPLDACATISVKQLRIWENA